MITNRALEAFQYASRNFNIVTERESPTAYLLIAFNNHKRERLEARRVELTIDMIRQDIMDDENNSKPGLYVESESLYTTIQDEFHSLKAKYIFDYDNQFTK